MDHNKMQDFIIGHLYFMIWYADKNNLYLAPDPLIFIGKNLDLEIETAESWYFQDPHSYCRYGSFPHNDQTKSDEPDGHMVCLRGEELNQMVDTDGLVEELKKCNQRWHNSKKKQ